MNIVTDKRCTKCGEVKVIEEFRLRRYSSTGKFYRCSQCKKCEHKGFKEYLRANPEKKKQYGRQYKSTESYRSWLRKEEGGKKHERNRNLRRFGLTRDQYDEMFRNQNGVCAICGGVNKDGRNLYIDHDHKTGRIRGLLCRHCNLILGLIEDNADRALNMSEYLRRT